MIEKEKIKEIELIRDKQTNFQQKCSSQKKKEDTKETLMGSSILKSLSYVEILLPDQLNKIDISAIYRTK